MLFLFIFSYLFLDERLACFLYEADIPRGLMKGLALPFTPALHPFLWTGLFLFKRCRATLFIASSVGLTSLFSKLLKWSCGRARPYLMFEDGTCGFYGFSTHDPFFSFPSGHAVVAMTLASTLAILYPKHRTPLLILGFCCSLFRVALNYHFLSDAIGGMLLALCVTKGVFHYLNPLERLAHHACKKIGLPYFSPHP